MNITGMAISFPNKRGFNKLRLEIDTLNASSWMAAVKKRGRQTTLKTRGAGGQAKERLQM